MKTSAKVGGKTREHSQAFQIPAVNLIVPKKV